jgi:hypothetical protein
MACHPKSANAISVTEPRAGQHAGASARAVQVVASTRCSDAAALGEAVVAKHLIE